MLSMPFALFRKTAAIFPYIHSGKYNQACTKTINKMAFNQLLTLRGLTLFYLRIAKSRLTTPFPLAV